MLIEKIYLPNLTFIETYLPTARDEPLRNSPKQLLIKAF